LNVRSHLDRLINAKNCKVKKISFSPTYNQHSRP